MEPTKLFKIADAVLACYIATISLLSAAMFFFVFILNWEDGFFGIKLDGLPAGIYLFCKGFVAFLLAVLVLKYRKKVELVTVCTIVYFAYLIWPVLYAVQVIPTFLGTLMYLAQFWLGIGIPVILLVIHVLARYNVEQPDGDPGRERE
ncbi:MAG: hypothetical protein WC342_07650 [Methanoregula sp.]|jgi:hypothetical protein